MTDEDFIAQIQSDAHDDSARLVYADWLEEQGDVRAEYLRLECELAGLTFRDALWKELYPRVSELREKMPKAWLAEIGRSRVMNCDDVSCPRSWHLLRDANARSVRMCDVCQSPVQFFSHPPEAAHHAVEENKVAIDAMVPTHEWYEVLRRSRQRAAGLDDFGRPLDRNEGSWVSS